MNRAIENIYKCWWQGISIEQRGKQILLSSDLDIYSVYCALGYDLRPSGTHIVYKYSKRGWRWRLFREPRLDAVECISYDGTIKYKIRYGLLNKKKIAIPRGNGIYNEFLYKKNKLIKEYKMISGGNVISLFHMYKNISLFGDEISIIVNIS